MISDEWYHRGGSFAEGGAFVHIELLHKGSCPCPPEIKTCKSPYTKAFGYKTLGLVMLWVLLGVEGFCLLKFAHVSIRSTKVVKCSGSEGVFYSQHLFVNI